MISDYGVKSVCRCDILWAQYDGEFMQQIRREFGDFFTMRWMFFFLLFNRDFRIGLVIW